jgi:ketosteroid isomerase-like protein
MSTPHSLREETPGEVRDAIHELDGKVRRHIQAGDAHAMVDGYYAEDARILPPGQGEV